MTEANKLEIPVIGTGDTNVDPDELDYIIPANDDAIRAIRLLCQLVADAAIEGAGQRAARASSEPEAQEPQGVDEPEFDETAAADLVAQLAAGGTLSFDPDLDDEDLLPGSPRPETPVPAGVAAADAPPPTRRPRTRPPTDPARRTADRRSARASTTNTDGARRVRTPYARDTGATRPWQSRPTPSRSSASEPARA